MSVNLDAFSHWLSPKGRQWVVLAGVGLVVFGVLYLVFWLSDQSKAPPSAAVPSPGQPSTFVQAPGAQVDPKDRWMGAAGTEVAKLRQEKQQQDSINNEFRAKLESLQKQLAAGAAPASEPPMPAATVAPAPSSFPPQAALTEPRPLPPPPPPARGAAGLPPGAPDSLGTPAGLVRVAVSPEARRLEVVASDQGGANPKGEARGKSVENYLPVSFAKAVLLGGLDAPTGGQSQTNPQPVILQLIDNAILPNHFRSQVKECFVIGAGYGDISSERAYIRTENLSCVRADGRTLEVKIQGSVFDETGKVGMKGRLVEKQGQILARALLAGIVSGIGQAFQLNSSTTSISPLGATTTVDNGKAFEAGIGAGVGRAMDRLAQYYVALAERVFPIIEVDSGRVVDVVLTKGVALEGWDAPETAHKPASALRQRVSDARELAWSSDDD